MLLDPLIELPDVVGFFTFTVIRESDPRADTLRKSRIAGRRAPQHAGVAKAD